MSQISAAGLRMIAEFTDNYFEKIFYFCLRRTSDSAEAEDLAQDIALHIISALNRGTVPGHFAGWVWQIARNRYAAWAENKHLRRDIAEFDCDSDEPKADAPLPDEICIHEEQLALLRRELAFIRSDYRDVVIAYYIKNMTLHDLAASLAISPEAAKKRLQRARSVLQEGMMKAREFGRRSYTPEHVTFIKFGRDGSNGQPWSIVGRLLYQNIFLTLHGEPFSAQTLALELGVALPYIEDVLSYLVKEELLREVGGKYETAFRILGKEEQRQIDIACRQVQKQLTDKLCTLIDLCRKCDCAAVNEGHVGRENAKWALLMYAFDALRSDAAVPSVYGDTDNPPPRPDGGCWVLLGFEEADWPEPAFVGCHSSDYGFRQYKFFYQNHQTKTPEFLSGVEAEVLQRICKGAGDACPNETVNRLCDYGYLVKINGKLQPNIVIIHHQTRKQADPVLSGLRQEILELFRQAPSITRGYIVEQALRDGWIRYDQSTDKTIGACIVL